MIAPEPGSTDTCDNCGMPIKYSYDGWRHDYAHWQDMLTCDWQIVYRQGLKAAPEVPALSFTAHRWLQGDPIPYDEMRILCGLPDLSGPPYGVFDWKPLGALASELTFTPVDFPEDRVCPHPDDRLEFRYNLQFNATAGVCRQCRAVIALTDEQMERGTLALAQGMAEMSQFVTGFYSKIFGDLAAAFNDALVPVVAFAESLPPEEDPHNVSRKPGEVPKPKRTPPMWAVDPSRSRRTRNRATDIRTPFR